MTAALALPAAKLAISAAENVLGGVKNLLQDPAKTKAKKQADDFETVFLEQVTERLFATPEGTEGPLGESGAGAGIFKSQLTQQYAKQIQRAGGIGLSDQIFRDLIQVQEKAATPAAAQAQAGIAGAQNVRG